MNRKHIPHLLILLCTLLTACREGNDGPTPVIAFYYWRTTFDPSPAERRTMEECGVRHLYIRYFDVKLDTHGRPVPESPIHFRSLPPKGVRVTPVVYITNAVMLSKEMPVDSLADRVAAYIRLINRTVGLPEAEEVQIDCDWSTGSRDRFMRFVDTLRSRGGFSRLSATIRLHQVKHHKITRIPAVDRGVLMYYNMGSIAPDSLNSIYDRHIAARYIESLRRYPLPLDVALPLYAWGVHVSDGRVTELIGRISRTDFEGDTNFIVTRGSNMILAKHANIKDGHYYRQGDRVKIEEVTANDLRGMASDLHRHLREKLREVIFFDLDEQHLTKYTDDEHEKDFLENVVRRF